MQLISLNDVEQGLDNRNEQRIPPAWVDQLEEAQFTLTKLKNKIDELRRIHDRHVHRPTFDDSSEDELLIETVTNEITTMFNSIHRLLQFIKGHSLEGMGMYFYLF